MSTENEPAVVIEETESDLIASCSVSTTAAAKGGHQRVQHDDDDYFDDEGALCYVFRQSTLVRSFQKTTRPSRSVLVDHFEMKRFTNFVLFTKMYLTTGKYMEPLSFEVCSVV
jgi:hypothetical protein